MSFWCLQIDQKTNEIFVRISALASKKRSNQNIIPLIWWFYFDSLTLFFWFDLFLEARAEILKKNSLVFWSKQWHHKDILKLTDLYAPHNEVKFFIRLHKILGPVLANRSGQKNGHKDYFFPYFHIRLNNNHELFLKTWIRIQHWNKYSTELKFRFLSLNGMNFLMGKNKNLMYHAIIS